MHTYWRNHSHLTTRFAIEKISFSHFEIYSQPLALVDWQTDWYNTIAFCLINIQMILIIIILTLLFSFLYIYHQDLLCKKNLIIYYYFKVIKTSHNTSNEILLHNNTILLDNAIIFIEYKQYSFNFQRARRAFIN